MTASRVLCAVLGSLVVLIVPALAGCATSPEDGDAVDVWQQPRSSLQLDNGCLASAGASGHSCQPEVASPSVVHFELAVDDWDGLTAGDLQLTDSCGGHVAIDDAQLDRIQGSWVPPAAGGPCILLGRATSAEGVIGASQLALYAHPGEAYPTTTLWLDATLRGDATQCALHPSTPSCGHVAAGSSLQLAGDASDLGLIEIDDSCAGPRRWFGAPSDFSVPSWTVPATPGMSCEVTVRGTSLSGNAKTIATRYTIVR